MKRKIHYILILMLLGFFMSPSVLLACGNAKNKLEKTCCKSSASQKKASCCSAKSAKKKSTDCTGKCKHKACQCSVTSSNYAITLNLFVQEFVSFTYFEMQTSYYAETNVTTGFFSVWLPPKIA